MMWKWFFDTSLDLADVLYACLKLYGIIELQTGSYGYDFIVVDVIRNNNRKKEEPLAMLSNRGE